MSTYPFANALILTGPTGCGKTRLSLELAERLGAEIISMDSMALYRRMDVGTAKPGPDERRRVPHHLLDVLEPWESASVAWWLGRAAACCRDITARGRRPLLVGGTALYLKAVLCGLFDGPPADAAVRARLTEKAERGGSEALHARLAEVDPAGAARLHPNDLRRVIRALEVWELTGRPISEWQTQWRVDRGSWIVDREPKNDPRSTIHDPRCLCLDLPRDVLYRRIDARVEQMIAQGLIDEVRALRELPRPLSREAAQALGYKEVFDHLDGGATLAETVAHIQTRSRNFAKRQLSWFRHLPGCEPVSEQLTFVRWGLTMTQGASGG
jgi:tRNA dimethylallyltransferase